MSSINNVSLRLAYKAIKLMKVKLQTFSGEILHQYGICRYLLLIVVCDCCSSSHMMNELEISNALVL